MTEINRRTFIQLTMAAGATATGLAGCKNEDIWNQEATGQYGGMSNRIYPYIDQPAGHDDGIPVYYATTCQMCTAGCGLYVRTLGGRANKIEGNPNHPVNRGATCVRGQLALQRLYNPDRLMFPAASDGPGAQTRRTTWENALGTISAALASAKGRTALLIDRDTISNSATKMSLIDALAGAAGATITDFSLVDDRPWRTAVQTVYGHNQLPDYRLDMADLIVSFGGNFLEAWPSPVRAGRLFGEFRQGEQRRQGQHGQFVSIGPRLTMTAAKADRWIPCIPGREAEAARILLQMVISQQPDLISSAASTGIDSAVLIDLASRIKGAGTKFVAVAGDGLFTSSMVTEAFLAVEQLNAAMRSECVKFGSVYGAMKRATTPISSLIGSMESGDVDTLICIGDVNPAFNLPAAAGWHHAISRVRFTASIGSFINETSSVANVAVPCRTFLEEWGDVVPAVLPSDTQMISTIQPVINPAYITRRHEVDGAGQPVQMMDTRELNDIILDLLRRLGRPESIPDSHTLVQKSWNRFRAGEWNAAVAGGGSWRAVTVPSNLRASGSQMLPSLPPVADNEFLLQLYPHPYFGDGRHANLGWAQETPDPLANAVWNCWAEINAAVAHRLGIRTGDLVRLTSEQGYIDLPALPSQAIHPKAIAVPLGQGHTAYGRNADNVGVNPLNLIGYVTDKTTGALAFSAGAVTLIKVSDAVSGYHPELRTLVLVEDRPGGPEPPAVKNLIHETAKEWLEQNEAGKPAAAKTRNFKPVI